MKIRVYIEPRRWLEVVFISPKDKRLDECHAYYVDNEGRTEKRGLFGTIYVRNDWKGARLQGLIAHELQHFYNDYINEQVATLAGKVQEHFWKSYERQKNV